MNNNTYDYNNQTDYSYQPNYTLSPNQYSGQPEKNSNNSQKKGRSATAWILIACILCSTVFGVGSSVLTTKLMGGQKQISIPSYSSDNSQVTEKTIYVSEDTYNTEAIVEKTKPSVVEITTESVTTSIFFRQYVTSGAGSGVILSEDGYIITNFHVIEGARKINVTTADGNSYSARVVNYDSEEDLALIKINASNLTAAEFGDSGTLKIGQKVLAIGNPLGELGGTVTQGIISSTKREIQVDGQTMELIQTDAAINPGNSGGGLFDESGLLVGIVNAKSSGSNIEGLGFAIPANAARQFYSKSINNEDSTPENEPQEETPSENTVKLGISVINIKDEITANMYNAPKMGVYILQVEVGSSAYNAGLQAGDCIDSINGTEIQHGDDIQNILAECSVGDTLEVQFTREGKQYNCQVHL